MRSQFKNNRQQYNYSLTIIGENDYILYVCE